MANFALVDENGVVQQVVAVNDNVLMRDGVEDESLGAQHLHELLGGRWIQTSMSAKFRSKFAGVGDIYDETLDIFHAPQPFPSWKLDTATGNWIPPTPMPPFDKILYRWSEDDLHWRPVE